MLTEKQNKQPEWWRLNAEEDRGAEHLPPEDGLYTTVSDFPDCAPAVNPPALVCMFVKRLHF